MTRGETRALHYAPRGYALRHGLRLAMDHADLVSILATCQSVDAPNPPTTPASDLTIVKSVYDVNRSPHANDRRHSVNNELGGLLRCDQLQA